MWRDRNLNKKQYGKIGAQFFRKDGSLGFGEIKAPHEILSSPTLSLSAIERICTELHGSAPVMQSPEAYD